MDIAVIALLVVAMAMTIVRVLRKKEELWVWQPSFHWGLPPS